ncbi:MAG: glycosyltransferase family 4 protein [Candidatus Methanoperedens sp.]
MFKYIFRKTDIIVSDSIPLREAAIALGATKDKNYIIQWGVDVTKFNPQVDRYKVRRRYELDNLPLIISPRAFTKNYNIDIIIRCIPDVLKEIPKAKFIFIFGFGDEEADMKKLADNLKVSDSVIFVGEVDYDDMPYYFAASDICISVPSSDSSPRSIYEAMACGVPPIISNLYWTKEYIKHEQNALLVPVNDSQVLPAAIIRLLTDRKLQKILKESNLKLVYEKLDYHKHMARMEEIYKLTCQANPEIIPDSRTKK